MTDYNSQNNRAVWFDIPVANLNRADTFYSEVLGISVQREEYEGTKFSILDHKDGNGGCLVENPDATAGKHGILLYMNVDGRIRDAASKVGPNGGKIIDDIHSIGPHGFRAIVLDSEGNRIALHSNSDA